MATRKMNKKLIIGLASVMLLGTLSTTTSISKQHVANAQENIAAKDNVEKKVVVTQKEIKEGKIISDYLMLQKKKGAYYYKFIDDNSLDQRLQKVGSAITKENVKDMVSKVNKKLLEENGHGELSDSITKFRKTSFKNNTIQTNTYFRGNACTWSFWGLSGYTGFVAAVAATASGPVGWAGFGLSLAIGAVGNAYC